MQGTLATSLSLHNNPVNRVITKFIGRPGAPEKVEEVVKWTERQDSSTNQNSPELTDVWSPCLEGDISSLSSCRQWDDGAQATGPRPLS